MDPILSTIYILSRSRVSACHDIRVHLCQYFFFFFVCFHGLNRPSLTSSYSHGNQLYPGKDKIFSCKGILIAIDHLRKTYGATHETLKAIVPRFRARYDSFWGTKSIFDYTRLRMFRLSSVESNDLTGWELFFYHMLWQFKLCVNVAMNEA